MLSDLVEKYEDQHHPINDASPVEMLEFYMEDRKPGLRALARGSGIAPSTLSEIMAGTRQMNLNHMRKLADFFKVPVAVFVPKAESE